MLSNCLKCKKNRENKSPEASKTKNGKIMLLHRCIVQPMAIKINQRGTNLWIVESIRNQASFE